MKNEKKKIVYVEPAEYIPEDLRRKYKLGEFAEPKNREEEMDEDCGGIKPIDPITPTPADYDRWGKTCVKFNDEPETEKN